jgi:hypothetical protein
MKKYKGIKMNDLVSQIYGVLNNWYEEQGPPKYIRVRNDIFHSPYDSFILDNLSDAIEELEMNDSEIKNILETDNYDILKLCNEYHENYEYYPTYTDLLYEILDDNILIFGDVLNLKN